MRITGGFSVMENPLLRLNGTAMEQQQNSNRISTKHQQNIRGRKQHEHQSDFSDSTLYYI